MQVKLVIVGMKQFLSVFIPCEMLNFLHEVLFVPFVDNKVWVSPECVWWSQVLLEVEALFLKLKCIKPLGSRSVSVLFLCKRSCYQAPITVSVTVRGRCTTCPTALQITIQVYKSNSSLQHFLLVPVISILLHSLQLIHGCYDPFLVFT